LTSDSLTYINAALQTLQLETICPNCETKTNRG